MADNTVRVAGKAERPAEARIVVPIYNEGENVQVLYDNLIKENVNFSCLSFVYDFEEDTSLPYIERLRCCDSRVSAMKNTLGRGVINALKFAFSKCEHGPVVVVMGDNSDKLSIIDDMLALWGKGAVVVSPSRYMKGGKQHGGGVIKAGLSRLAGVSLGLLGLPTCDPTNNFKLYDGDWLRSQNIESEAGFEIAIELIYKAYRDGKTVVEIPTEWFDRTEGESRFNLTKWLPHYLRWYFKTAFLLIFRAEWLTRNAQRAAQGII